LPFLSEDGTGRGTRDQEHQGLKPAQANNFVRPYLKKKKNHKKGMVEWLKW
jgi:hypothetical protein